MRKVLWTILALALTAASFPAQCWADGVSVERVWARATAPTARNGAVFLTLHNSGEGADRLLAAESPAAETVELHDMSMQDGVMRMRPVDGIDLPAGETVALQPRGLHIMLIGLKEPLVEGGTLPLTLRFEAAGERAVEADIQSIGARGLGGMHGMDRPMDHSGH